MGFGVHAAPLAESERQFGRYELLFRLAVGGMAQVYVGRLRGVQGFEKLLAIKCIHDELAEDEDFIKMFIDEARVSARISHPNVVQVLELGQVGDAYFIAMEYVHGESLSALLRRKCPPPTVCARIAAECAAGLQAAQPRGGPAVDAQAARHGAGRLAGQATGYRPRATGSAASAVLASPQRREC